MNRIFTKKFIKTLCIVTLFCCILSSNVVAVVESKQSKLIFNVNNSLIDIQAEDIGFKHILKVLEKKTGIKINIFEDVQNKKVSLNIKSLPIFRVGTILNRMRLINSAVVYDKQSRPIAIFVLPEGKDRSKSML